MIRLTYINNIFSQIETDVTTKNKLVALFTFREPGFMFSRAYKEGYWNGYRQLFNGSYIYNGLVPYVIKWAKKYNIEVISNIKSIKQNTTDELDEFVKSTTLSSFNKKTKEFFNIDIRDYQENSLKEIIKNKKIVISSPTSSGKSLIIYLTSRFCQFRKLSSEKILIIVPSKVLVKQMYQDFIDYSYYNKWNTEDNCSRISSDFKKDFNKDIIITTYQSIVNESKHFFEQFKCVILDECHTAESFSGEKAKQLHTILDKCTNASYLVGFTGTFPDEPLNRLILLRYFNDVYTATDYDELLSRSEISNFEICPIQLNHIVHKSGFQYRDELNYIYSDKYRNDFLLNLLNKNDNNQLLLFTEIQKHAIVIYHLLKNDERFKDHKIILLQSETKQKARDEVKNIIENNNNVILLATYKLLGTGWSVNNLHNLIFACPLKKKRTVLQAIGRGLRLLNKDKVCKIYDIIDKFSYNNVLFGQWKERAKHYESAGFEFKINNIIRGINNEDII